MRSDSPYLLRNLPGAGAPFAAGDPSRLRRTVSKPVFVGGGRRGQYELAEYRKSVADPEGSGTPVVWSGRKAYHSHHRQESRTNAVVDPYGPTVGVELETVASDEDAAGRIRSNWFYFECDGSLPSNGWELVTIPLPPSVYRDPRTWAGLQSAIGHTLSSASCRETGLHVHVGTDVFAERAAASPLLSHSGGSTANTLGRLMVSTLYNALDEELLRSVFRRARTTFCGETKPLSDGMLFSLASSGVSSADFVAAAMLSARGDSCGCRRTWLRPDQPPSLDSISCLHEPGNFGHYNELNFSHLGTIEFRRGKGTVNSSAVFMMVDFCSLMVNFCAAALADPDEPFGVDAFLAYAAEDAASADLVRLVRERTAADDGVAEGGAGEDGGSDEDDEDNKDNETAPEGAERSGSQCA